MRESLYFWTFVVNFLVTRHSTTRILEIPLNRRQAESLRTEYQFKQANSMKILQVSISITLNQHFFMVLLSHKKNPVQLIPNSLKKSPQSISYFHLLVSISKIIGNCKGMLKPRASYPSVRDQLAHGLDELEETTEGSLKRDSETGVLQKSTGLHECIIHFSLQAQGMTSLCTKSLEGHVISRPFLIILNT